jgi:hypothetical protein
MTQTAKNDEFIPANVVPYLLGIRQAELEQPLGLYQSEEATEPGTRRLAAAINDRMPIVLPVADLEEAFGHWWPELDDALESARTMQLHPSQSVARNPEDMLEELLSLTRGIARSVPDRDDVEDVIVARVNAGIQADRFYHLTKTLRRDFPHALGTITFHAVRDNESGEIVLDLATGVERTSALDEELRATVEAFGYTLSAINETND